MGRLGLWLMFGFNMSVWLCEICGAKLSGEALGTRSVRCGDKLVRRKKASGRLVRGIQRVV